MIITREKNSIYYRIAFTHALFIIVIASTNRKIQLLPIFILYTVIVIFPNFMSLFLKNLKAIEINENNICLIFNKYFKEVKEVYEYKNLNFTYKMETGGKGSRSWQFRIYKNGIDKSLFSTVGFDGWTDDRITDIILELRNKGIMVE